MLFIAPLCASLLLAAPDAGAQVDRFIHLLGGAPVGEIELRRSGPAYSYLSRHFFRRGRVSEERFEHQSSGRPGEPTWASESLLLPHPLGCWPVEDELTHRRGENCVSSRGEETVAGQAVVAGSVAATGTCLGKKFTARYRHGRLEQLEFAESQFLRSDQSVEFKDPFGEGFAIRGEGPRLELSPPLEGTRTANPGPATAPQDDCLLAAQEYLSAHGAAWELVLGLIEDEGRGWPHAWVRHRTTKQEVDPSRASPEGEPLRYLALPASRAAQVYLELLGKQRTLVRRAAGLK